MKLLVFYILSSCLVFLTVRYRRCGSCNFTRSNSL